MEEKSSHTEGSEVASLQDHKSIESDEDNDKLHKAHQEDNSRNVKPWWRTATLVLGPLTAILTALGPITAWINGEQDRKLQDSQMQDEISLRYMDLLLRRSESVEVREMTLSFLEKALAAEKPRDLMLELVKEQLANIEKASKLEKQLTASHQRIGSLEKELAASQEREQLALKQASSTTSETKSVELRTQLDAERQRIAKLQEELDAERKSNADLRVQLAQAEAATGAKSANVKLSHQDLRDPYFEDWPEADAKVARLLDALCTGHGGRSSFVYFGPNEPGVACRVSDDTVLLDEASLKPTEVFAPNKQGPALLGRLAGECESLGGKPVGYNPLSSRYFGYSGYDDEVLCRLDKGGRGIRIVARGL